MKDSYFLKSFYLVQAAQKFQGPSLYGNISRSPHINKMEVKGGIRQDVGDTAMVSIINAVFDMSVGAG